MSFTNKNEGFVFPIALHDIAYWLGFMKFINVSNSFISISNNISNFCFIENCNKKYFIKCMEQRNLYFYNVQYLCVYYNYY